MTRYDPIHRALQRFPRLGMIPVLLTMAAAMLTGCGAQPTRPAPLSDVVLVPQNTEVVIPKETLRPCDPLPHMEERAYTQLELLGFMQEVVTPFADCRARKTDQTKTMNKAFNSK